MQEDTIIPKLHRHEVLNQLSIHVAPSPQVETAQEPSFLLQVELTKADFKGDPISICRPLTDKPRRQPTKSFEETCPGRSSRGSTVGTPPTYSRLLLKFSVL